MRKSTKLIFDSLKIFRIIRSEKAHIRTWSERWVEMGRHLESKGCSLASFIAVKAEIRTTSVVKQIGELTVTQNKS